MQTISTCSRRDFSQGQVRSLVRFFALKCAQDRDLPIRPLSAEAEDLLIAHDWHGDLSVMETTIRRAAIMADGDRIGPETIRLPDGQPNSADNARHDGNKMQEAATRTLLGRTVSDVECDLILLTVECCCGNRTQAADILGISVRTLRNKFKEYANIGIRIPPVCEAKRTNTANAKRHDYGQPIGAAGR